MSVMSLGLALSKCGYTNNHCSSKWYCNERFVLPMMNFDRTVWKSLTVGQQVHSAACWEHFSNLLLTVTGELAWSFVLLFNPEMSVLVGRISLQGWTYMYISNLSLMLQQVTDGWNHQGWFQKTQVSFGSHWSGVRLSSFYCFFI